MKIFEVGLTPELRTALTGRGFVVCSEQLASPVELGDWLAGLSCEAVMIDFDSTGWNRSHTVHTLRGDRRPTTILGMAHLSDRASERAAFLNAGGDDLLHNPVNLEELVATLHATVRRSLGRKSSIHCFTSADGTVVTVDVVTRTISAGVTPVLLSRRETSLMCYLALHSECHHSRGEIIEAIYTDVEEEPNSNCVETFVGRIRRKLDRVHEGTSAILSTLYGQGYRLTSATVS